MKNKISTLKDLGFHPDRIYQQHAQFEWAVQHYTNELDKAIRAVKIQTDNIQHAVKKLEKIKAYMRQEDIEPGNLPPAYMEGDCKAECLKCVREGKDEWEPCRCDEPEWCMDWRRIHDLREEVRANK